MKGPSTSKNSQNCGRNCECNNLYSTPTSQHVNCLYHVIHMVILASTAPHMEFPLPGYNYVELRVAFKEDLHPFYPPTIAVLRPRLYGRCLATATHKDFCDSHIYV